MNLEESQKAKKKAQLARLAAKGTPGYSALYESQPEQQRIKAEQQAQRRAERQAKEAGLILATQEANEAANIFASSEKETDASSEGAE